MPGNSLYCVWFKRSIRIIILLCMVSRGEVSPKTLALLLEGDSMVDEEKVLGTEEIEDTAAAASEGAAPKKKRNRKKTLTIWGVIIGVIAVLGIGFTIWHNTPSFCGAICHTPMDSYVEGYNDEHSVHLIAKHAAVQTADGKDIVCITCHEPKIQEQVMEAVHWVSGNFEYNDQTRQLSQRRDYASYENSGVLDNDGFCINEGCHTLDQLELVNNIYTDYPPHSIYMGMDSCSEDMSQLDCGSCHRMHEASVMYCTKCHEDAPVPGGWVSYEEGQATDRPIYHVAE